MYCMRYLLTVLCLCFGLISFSQKEKIDAISFSYFGEMIKHPGIKINADFPIKEWDKNKSAKEDYTKVFNKSIILSPALGMYYHKRYQTGLFIVPEIKYQRKNYMHSFLECGIGLGYLRTFIPNTFEVDSNGEVKNGSGGHDYLVTNYFITFGKDFIFNKPVPIAYYIKPQFMYAVPNFPTGIAYFALEIGFRYRFNFSFLEVL